MRRRNKAQSLGIQNISGTKPCGIGQSGITLSQNTSYELRTITQCDAEAELHVTLQDPTGNKIYAEETFPQRQIR